MIQEQNKVAYIIKLFKLKYKIQKINKKKKIFKILC